MAGNQVGKATLPIFPVMNGFRAKILKETQQAGAEGSNAFSSAFNRNNAGSKIGSKLKTEFAKTAGDLGKNALKGFEKDVAAATQANATAILKQKDASIQLESAMLKQRQASERVTQAQEKYNSAVAKSGADSSQAKQAADQLQQAQLRLEAADNRVAQAKQKVSSAQEKASQTAQRLKDAQDALARHQQNLATSSDTTGNAFTRLADKARQLGSELKDKISAGAQHAKQSLESFASVSMAALGTGLAAASKHLLDIGKNAFHSYAQYEQLVGGVDTLFKDASGQLQAYAAQAYKTAGMSANQYMEQVTSFSASLISSLGGDTKLAAEVGNKAIIDMSDNANKMGTSMTDIQNAYQGFAKQHYGMLDNLKLGYGGTKQEMERLIQDANRVKQANGQMATLSIDSFADVVEAIHTIQDEMGITGTTSKEAASTIEGSVNMMKAAWKNWQTGLGQDDADLDKLTKELIDSIETVLKNSIPRIKIIAKSMFTAIPDALAGMVDLLPAPVQKVIDTITNLFSSGKEVLAPVMAAFAALGVSGLAPLLSNIPLVGGLLGKLATPLTALGGPIGIVTAAFAGLVAVSPQLQATLGTVVQSVLSALGQTLQSMLPTVQMLADQFAAFAQTVMPMVVDVLNQLLPIISSILIALMPLIPQVLTPLIDLISAMLPIIGQVIEAILPIIEQVLPVLQQLILDIIPPIMEIISAILPALSQLVQDLAPIIVDVISAISDVLNALLPLVTGIIQTITDCIVNILLPNVRAMLPVVQSVISTISSVVRSVSGVVKGVIDIIAGLFSGDWQRVWNGIKGVVKNAIDAVKKIFGGAVDIGKNFIKGLWDGISNMGKWLWDKISGFCGGIMDNIKGFFGIHSPSRVMRDQVGKMLSRGIAVGIDADAKKVYKTMDKLSSGIMDHTLDAIDIPANINTRGASGYSAYASQPEQRTIIQNFSTKIIRSDEDLYTSGSILVRNAIHEGRYA